MSEVAKVQYRGGMLDSLRDRHSLAVIVFDAPNIPPTILEAFEANKILDAAGTYGDPEVGEPIQYDWLSIDHESGGVVIEVFNRAIALFTEDDEQMRRIHRVLCVIDDHCIKGN